MNGLLMKLVTKALNAAAMGNQPYLREQQTKPGAAALSKPLYLANQQVKPGRNAAAVKQHLQKDRQEQPN